MLEVQGIRVLVDRLGLPPRLAEMVRRCEEECGPLEQVNGTPGEGEVRQILGMVDGQNLLAALVAKALNEIEVPAEVLKTAETRIDRRTDYDRWAEARDAYPDRLVILNLGEGYIAFETAAERVLELVAEHPYVIDGHSGVALSGQTYETWTAALIDGGLDATIVSESDETDSGFDSFELLDTAEA